jgi:hypothetical protein
MIVCLFLCSRRSFGSSLPGSLGWMYVVMMYNVACTNYVHTTEYTAHTVADLHFRIGVLGAIAYSGVDGVL